MSFISSLPVDINSRIRGFLPPGQGSVDKASRESELAASSIFRMEAMKGFPVDTLIGRLVQRYPLIDSPEGKRRLVEYVHRDACKYLHRERLKCLNAEDRQVLRLFPNFRIADLSYVQMNEVDARISKNKEELFLRAFEKVIPFLPGNPNIEELYYTNADGTARGGPLPASEWADRICEYCLAAIQGRRVTRDNLMVLSFLAYGERKEAVRRFFAGDDALNFFPSETRLEIYIVADDDEMARRILEDPQPLMPEILMDDLKAYIKADNHEMVRLILSRPEPLSRGELFELANECREAGDRKMALLISEFLPEDLILPLIFVWIDSDDDQMVQMLLNSPRQLRSQHFFDGVFNRCVDTGKKNLARLVLKSRRESDAVLLGVNCCNAIFLRKKRLARLILKSWRPLDPHWLGRSLEEAFRSRDEAMARLILGGNRLIHTRYLSLLFMTYVHAGNHRAAQLILESRQRMDPNILRTALQLYETSGQSAMAQLILNSGREVAPVPAAQTVLARIPSWVRWAASRCCSRRDLQQENL